MKFTTTSCAEPINIQDFTVKMKKMSDVSNADTSFDYQKIPTVQLPKQSLIDGSISYNFSVILRMVQRDKKWKRSEVILLKTGKEGENDLTCCGLCPKVGTTKGYLLLKDIFDDDDVFPMQTVEKKYNIQMHLS